MTYIFIDVREEFDIFNKNYKIMFGKHLPITVFNELIYQVFDVFLNYGLRISDPTGITVISRLQALPDPNRFSVELFLGTNSPRDLENFKGILFGLAISVYTRLKNMLPVEKEFNFVIKEVLHTQGKILIEYFNF